MATQFVFPGSFCPPTYGHLAIVNEAAKILPNLTVNCSRNPTKDNWFSMKKCASLWRAYSLPDNVIVKTFDQIRAENLDLSEIVMVRGLRDPSQLQDEARVMDYNKYNYGIEKYLYLVSEDKLRDVSSSKARELALNAEIDKLGQFVAPLVISDLLEKALEQKNIFLVVGKTGGGKSTLLQEMAKLNKRNIHINTDQYNKALRPLLESAFPGQDLIQVATKRPGQLAAVINKPWLNLLRHSLITAPKDSNLFIEVPYGLMKDKELFRYLGGKVLYVGCDDAEYERRIIARGDSHLLPFVEQIPGLDESCKIAAQHHLNLRFVNTEGPLSHLITLAKELSDSLNEGGKKC